jgi:hypothetical protein
MKNSSKWFIPFFGFLAPFFVNVTALVAEEKKPDIHLYYSETTEPFDNANNLTPDGISQKLLEEFFKKSGLTYKGFILPWGRILRISTQEDNALIFQLIRNKERENKFHWLLPFSEEGEEIYLYNRNSPELDKLSKDEIFTKDYKAICEKNSAQCVMLLHFGFKDENIIRVPLSKTTNIPQLLLRGRGEFMVQYKTSFEQIIHNFGLNKSLFAVSYKLPVLPYYVAGSKNMSPDLLKRIIVARDKYWDPNL